MESRFVDTASDSDSANPDDRPPVQIANRPRVQHRRRIPRGKMPQAKTGDAPQVETGEASENQSVERPQTDSGDTPQAEGGETPQAEGGDTPQAEQGGDTPQAEQGGDTPQAEQGADTPQAEGGETAQAESSETPQAQGGDTPQAEGVDAPQAETVGASEKRSADRRQSESGDRPQAESGDRPQADTDDASEIQSVDRPRSESGDRSQIESDDRPQVETGDTSEHQFFDRPQGESGDKLQAETDNASENQFVDRSQVESDGMPQIETSDTLQAETSDIWGSQSFDRPETETSDTFESSIFGRPLTDTADGSQIETGDGSQTESGDTPQAETRYGPQAEAGDTSLIQSVDSSLIQSICMPMNKSLDLSSEPSTIKSGALCSQLPVTLSDLSSLPTIRSIPTIESLTLSAHMRNFPLMVNNNILTTIRSRQIEPIPVWIMKQTGRYLPEFRSMCNKHGYLNICHNPRLAAAATLLPMEIFDLDAAMVFSNMLNVPEALGMELIVHPKAMFPRRLCIDELPILEVEGAIDRLKHVGETIRLVRQRLNGTATVFGFSGAPWTLMSYMIEGKSSDKYSSAKKWFYMHKEQAQILLETLADVVADFCIMQAKYGAQVIQLYDQNAEYLDKATYDKLCIPGLKLIREKVRTELEECELDIPMAIYIKRPTCLEELVEAGYDIISLDWSTNPASFGPELKDINICLQGNLDPCVLYGTPDTIRERVFEMLKKFDGYRLIANLGEPIYKDIPVENVHVFIDAVRSYRRAK